MAGMVDTGYLLVTMICPVEKSVPNCVLFRYTRKKKKNKSSFILFFVKYSSDDIGGNDYYYDSPANKLRV